MKKHTRLTALAAAATAAVMTLAACGGNGESGQADDACTPDNPCTLTFRWWGGEERQARQRETIAIFEENNPGIRITALPVSFDGYYDLLGVEMSGRNAPDIFTLDRSWPLEYGQLGGLADLTAISSLDLSAFPDTALVAARIGDAVYGVPNGGNATGLIINADLFAQAGVELPDEDTWTWDDFIALAEQISAATPDGVFGAEVRPHDFINAFATQRDGYGLFTPEGDIAVSQETLDDFFTLLLDLQVAGASPGASQTSELMAAGPEETLMGRGLSAMLFAPSNQIGAYAAASGADLRLIRIPGESEFSHVGTTVLPSQFFAISADSDYPEAAGLFVSFLINDLQAGEIMGVDRGNPVNPYVAAHIAPYLTEIQREQVNFMERITAFAGPTVAQPTGAGEVQSITTRAMDEVLFGRQSTSQAAQAWLEQMQASLDTASH